MPTLNNKLFVSNYHHDKLGIACVIYFSTFIIMINQDSALLYLFLLLSWDDELERDKSVSDRIDFG